jgi:hypothetical protein
MVPDFEYFLRMSIHGEYSHTIAGIFWFDLPLGLLLTFIFHNIVRNSLFNNLPLAFKSRFTNFKQFDWNSYFKSNWQIVIVSILIGTASHLFWDGFTHDGGYFVQIIPFLTNTVEISGQQISVAHILQHVSSLIGGLVIVFSIFKLPANKDTAGQISLKYWVVLTTLTVIIVALRFSCGLNLKLYGHIIITIIAAGLLSLIITSFLVRKKGTTLS